MQLILLLTSSVIVSILPFCFNLGCLFLFLVCSRSPQLHVLPFTFPLCTTAFSLHSAFLYKAGLVTLTLFQVIVQTIPANTAISEILRLSSLLLIDRFLCLFHAPLPKLMFQVSVFYFLTTLDPLR